MKTLINRLKYEIHYEDIDNDFSIVKFKTSEMYIKFGAAILDNEDIHAKSIAFENGPQFYALLNKGEEKQLRFIDLKDPTISFEVVGACNVPTYLLIRLFINYLNNFKNESFNNLGGSFYKIHKITYNGKYIEVLKLSVTADYIVEVSATKFMQVTQINKAYPLYTFSGKNNSFKRVYEIVEQTPTYINKSPKKTEIQFLDIVKKEGRACFIYDVIEKVNKNYSKYINLKLEEIEIIKKIDSLEKEFMDTTISQYKKLPCYVLNLSNTSEDKYGFYKIKECIEKYTGSNIRKVSKINPDGINLVYIHDADYYADNKLEDPYKKLSISSPVQRFTVENYKSYFDNNGEPSAALKTILKESVIKHDVFIKNELSFDDWNRYNFKNDWIFGIAKETKNDDEKNEEYYFITIHPNGKFECKKFVNTLFSADEYELYRQTLAGTNGSTVFIKDDNGNINLIEQTNMYTLPNLEYYKCNVGRGKNDRDGFYPGLVDINYYDLDGIYYYNVGPYGTGMQSSIPKASHLYKINVINNSKSIVKDLLDLMGVSFVKYNSFTVLPYPIKYLREFAKID